MLEFVAEVAHLAVEGTDKETSCTQKTEMRTRIVLTEVI